MNKAEIDEVESFMREITASAGKIFHEDYYHLDRSVTTKECFADLVTKSDLKIEQFLFGHIKEKYPSHRLIGEETANSACSLTESPTWIIDPIDGTTNFIHRCPFTAISIGFFVNKQSELGIVFNPIQKETFFARRNAGAFLNGDRIYVNKTTDINTALVCAEFGSNRDKQPMDVSLQNMRNVIDKCHGIRSMGSAAINMTMVACGRADAYYEVGPHCWDFAAGSLIVREAGGIVTHIDGGEFDIMSRHVLAGCTKELTNQISPLITGFNFKRDDE